MPYISIGRKGLSDELDRLKKSDIEDQYLESWELKEVLSIVPVSYTHLTLPTILLV